MESLEDLLKQYDYDFPAELIAKEPSEPRHAAKLMVLNKENGEIKHDTFWNLGKYLPEKTLLVFNNTKVIPARLKMRVEKIGLPTNQADSRFRGNDNVSKLVEVLYLKSLNNSKIECLINKKLGIGEKLLLNTKKIPVFLPSLKASARHGTGMTGVAQQEMFKILEKKDGVYIIEFLGEGSALDIFLKYGEMPLPPYIKNSPLSEKEKMEKYQTTFGEKLGSVAAPTASLHFSEELLNELRRTGIEMAFITLHVSLGTFAPLKEEQIKNEKLHEEWYEISDTAAEKINDFKNKGYKILAVGTTALRTLESAVENKEVKEISGTTNLFIREGYKFKMIDGLITNFHVPRSSLLMLVSALCGRENILKAYQEAIKMKYKLFSFGDGMLIL